MTALEKGIYDYLLAAYVEDNSTWVSQQELIDNFSELKLGKTTSHDKCSNLRTIINHINDEVEQIVVIDNFKYKIATNEEAEDSLVRDWKRVLPRLSRYYKKVKKIKKDGQFDFLNDRFMEVFLRDGNRKKSM